METELYPWDTKEQQSLARPYGFTDLVAAPGFFEEYLARRKSALDFFAQVYLSRETEDDATMQHALQTASRFSHILPESVLSKNKSLSYRSNSIESAEFYSSDDLNSTNEIDTSKMISTLYDASSNGPITDAVLASHFLRLLKKADLKKLGRSYGQDFRNLNDQPLALADYSRLAIVLLTQAKSGDLQALSTGLKLNDSIVSGKDSVKNSLEAILAFSSLRLEQEQIDSLAKQVGGH